MLLLMIFSIGCVALVWNEAVIVYSELIAKIVPACRK